MKQTKIEILKYFGAVRRATHYHLANMKGLSTPGSKGANRIRNVAYHLKQLTAMKLITPCSQAESSVYSEKYRHQYFELTTKGAREVGIEDHKLFGIFSTHDPSYPHQYGLQTAISSIYLNCGFSHFKAYFPADKKELGYRPDAIIETNKGKFIIEHERCKSMNDLVKDIRKRDKLVTKKGYQFLYIINVDRAKNSVDPTWLYDHESKFEKGVEQFMKDLLHEIRDLPSYKYRFQVLHNFERFGDGVWLAPGKKETFKL